MRWPRRTLSVLGRALRGGARLGTSRPLALTVAASVVAAGVAFGGVTALEYMETPAFCSRCHTMEPQVVAHLNSPHEGVECTQCHVGRGLKGLIKSKIDGFQQMVKLIAGTYARPIPPAAHDLPPPSETCLRCHDPARQRGDLLVTRSHFQEDEANTEQRVALVVRLGEAAAGGTHGIHWHVLSTVHYVAAPDSGRIVWIGVDKPDGTHEEFLARDQVEITEQAAERAKEISASGEQRRMTCYDCHNRVGHEFTRPATALDEAMVGGSIDPALPNVKRWGLEVLETKYASTEAAYRAMGSLAVNYHRDYPFVFLERPQAVPNALRALAAIYSRTASPEMQEFPEGYPSYLGHKDSAGCFRCHDGGHFKIVDGALSNEAIPARCDLCHTFPSVGERVPNVMIGPPPSTHRDRLWVFDHKDVATTREVSLTSCNTCHSQAYCSNCHNSGAALVNHDDMYFRHASVIRKTTQQPCAYCHQRPFCEQCHREDGVKIEVP